MIKNDTHSAVYYLLICFVVLCAVGCRTTHANLAETAAHIQTLQEQIETLPPEKKTIAQKALSSLRAKLIAVDAERIKARKEANANRELADKWRGARAALILAAGLTALVFGVRRFGHL